MVADRRHDRLLICRGGRSDSLRRYRPARAREGHQSGDVDGLEPGREVASRVTADGARHPVRRPDWHTVADRHAGELRRDSVETVARVALQYPIVAARQMLEQGTRTSLRAYRFAKASATD